MFARSWDLYLNGNLTYQGTDETILAPIPRSFVRPDGTIDIAIRADAGTLPYQGIANRGDLVIGPRAKLAPLTFFSHDNATSLQLLYLLPKLAFCVVFSLLFMFMSRNREILWFLVFGLASSLELYFRSDYSGDLGLTGETRALLALMARNYSLLLLARFVYAFFRLHLQATERVMRAATIGLTIFNLLCLFTLSYQFTTKSLDIIAIVIKPAVFVFWVILAF